MAVLAFLAGLPIAPVVMSAYGLVDSVAKRGPRPRRSRGSRPRSRRPSVGMALGGALIDAFGVRASFAFGAAAASWRVARRARAGARGA